MNFKLIEMNVLTAQATELAWYQQMWFVVLAWVVAMAICFVISSFLAKRFRLPDYWWKIATILTSVVTAFFIIGASYNKTYPDLPVKLGVDLRGGVSIIGEMQETINDGSGNRITINDLIPALKERIDPSGTKEISLTPMGTTKLEVIIPDADLAEAKRVWSRLASAGNLIFRIIVNSSDNAHASIYQTAKESADLLQEYVRSAPTEENPDGEIIARWIMIKRNSNPERPNPNPPFSFIPNSEHLVRDRESGEIVDMRSVPLPQNRDENVVGQALADWAKANGIRDLEVLTIEPDERMNVQGKDISRAAESMDNKGQPAVDFFLKGEGIRKMHRMTTSNIDRQMGIILDGQLLSAPTINSEISTNGQIYGLSREEAEDLVIVLNSGKLEVALKDDWISVDFVESSLGEQLKTQGLWAIGIAFVLVFVFVLVYYRFAGVVACFALLMNLVLIFALVVAMKVPVSLTGLAGIVLTVGMAVDANVLIFERIREEISRGAKLRMAIRNGFDRATATIIDANLTTLITALVLYLMGTEQLKSFSAVLIIGILMSMFTAVFCARVVFEIAERQRWISSLSMSNFVGDKTWDFIGKRQATFLASAIIIVAGIVALAYRGDEILDYDLRGGQTARVVFKEKTDTDEVAKALEGKYTFNGDPVKFEVTEISQFLNADGELEQSDGTNFKISCSLKVWDGEEDERPAEYRNIEQMIKETFAGKLEMYNVNYDPEEISFSEVPLNQPGVSLRSAIENTEVTVKPNAFASVGLRPIPAKQQQPVATQENTQDETGKSEGSETEQTNPPGQSKDSQAENQAGADQNNSTQDNSADNNAKVDPAKQDPANVDGAGNGAGNGGQSNPNAQDETTGRSLFDASVELNFKREIEKSNLIERIVAASQSLPNVQNLQDRDIKAVASSESGAATSAKSWKVTFRTGKKEYAREILAKTQEDINSEPVIPSTTGVGGQIAGQMQQQAAAAILASLIGIVAYVWFRFQNVAFGLAAVVALIHDVLVVLGAIAVSYWLSGGLSVLLVDNFKISLPVVAAFLTIIGYSLNDTIVVFDRIREVRGKRSEMTAEMINVSISQTLGRTLLTSITTFIVVIILFAMGGEAIHGFAFALVVGVIVGTYSSIFVASPVLLYLMNRNKPAAAKDVKEAIA
jgi:SecD/SecF fusion protein